MSEEDGNDGNIPEQEQEPPGPEGDAESCSC